MVAAATLNAAGLVLYGVGLLAPLTPSPGEGTTIREALVFAGGPLALQIASLFFVKGSIARLLIHIEVVLVAAFTALLLFLQRM